VAGIEAGSECERLAPLLSALADGEASAADLGALRPHLRTCLSCRARPREFRAAPARVAALAPPLALAGGGGGATLRSWLESLAGAAQHKAAALAGGGATVDKLKQPPARPPVDQRQTTQPVGPSPVVQPVAQEAAEAAPAPVAQAPPTSAPKPAPPPDSATEFSPAAAAPIAPAPAALAGGPHGGGGGSEFGP
jgi:hypothetical protein